jgi:F0F1-type ATP synthase assembly protein I
VKRREERTPRNPGYRSRFQDWKPRRAVGFPISLPFGIWALIVLSRRDVRTAFADWHAKSERKKSDSALERTMVVGLVVGLAVGLSLGAAMENIPLYMTLGMTFGMALGIVCGWRIDMNNRRKSKD